MKLLRNPEVFHSLLIFIVISVPAVFVSWVWDKDFGAFTLLLCILFLVLNFLITYRRYKRIAELSMDINRILHDEENISLEKYSEGELAILQSEIYKMTVRLREQKKKLIDDKVYLADSIADISHRIRTPLTSINLLLTLLSDKDISNEKHQTLIQELYSLLSRIDWLITTLLKMSKLDAGTIVFKKENISADRLIDLATAPLLVAMELRNQNLILHADGDITIDVSWTCEAILNIVKNCMEHTPNGGTITISAGDNFLFTEIIIEDNGKGIMKEDLPYIFERFYKGKNSSDTSFGIGLALSRMIITGQNGTVKAENNAQQGAKFTIRFYKGTV